MVWNTTAPDGTKSVKANTTILQANTTYTEETLGNNTATGRQKDHFWNVGVDEDGHHRAVRMQNYAETYTGAPADPVLGSGIDGAIYIKDTAEGRTEGFYRNVNGIYQFIPSFKSGTFATNGSNYVNVVSVPNNCYGTITLYLDFQNITYGYFVATNNVVHAYSSIGMKDNGGTYTALRLGNTGQTSGLTIIARVSDGGAGNYNFRVVYWQL